MRKTRTPASLELFKTRPTTKLLEGPKGELFHTFVMKLLYLTKRVRPDISTAISFLTTRVAKPDHDDWNMLTRVVSYFHTTRDKGLTLVIGQEEECRWWVDASYGVHGDMRSHTGSVVSLGRGAVAAHSLKQKLNLKSSTEAEIIAVYDVSPHIFWMRHFL